MVRKVIISAVCAIAVFLAVPITASAYAVYPDNIPSEYVEVFRDITNKIPSNEDYVLYRADDAQYVLVSGDLEFVDGSFLGDNVTMYMISTAPITEEVVTTEPVVVDIIDEVTGEKIGETVEYEETVTTTTTGSALSYVVSTEEVFNLSVGSSLVYSNLSNYPSLQRGGDMYGFATVTLLLIGICCYLFRSIFSFCLRLRS